jgi:phospholipid/cholesterol/gamma-HCH transport system ATP-binding protein
VFALGVVGWFLYAMGTRGACEERAAAIECRDVHKSLGGAEVLAGIDLTVPAGAISVIVGPSRAGKSVLVKHVNGLLRPDRGEVVVLGQPVSRLGRQEVLRLRRDVGILFQDGALFGSLNVYDNVAFPLRQHTDMTEAEIAPLVMTRLPPETPPRSCCASPLTTSACTATPAPGSAGAHCSAARCTST